MSCYLSLAGGENDQQLEQHQQRQKSRCFLETTFSSYLQYVFMDFNSLVQQVPSAMVAIACINIETWFIMNSVKN